MWKMTKSNYYEVIDGTTMYYEDYVKQLQQEIKDLKETLKGTTHCYDEEEHKRLNDILSKFEKWLEERYKQQTETLNKMEEDNIERPYVKSRRYLVEECLDKLQELKGGKK